MPASTPLSYSAPIVAVLKERILTWQYPPEHRLTEDGLCREFGVSRTPVREALRLLAANGFVRRMENRGYAVRQVKVKELEELYEVRLALESFAVETLAGRNAPSAELSAMKRVWSALRKPPKRNVEELAQLDALFHEELAALVNNEMLLKQLKAINERLLIFRMIDFAKPDRIESTCRQHLAILERIEAGDAAGAREAMRRNIDDGRSIVGASVKEALARAFAY
jgi:DNA-binding GntR family transcriptional regulator